MAVLVAVFAFVRALVCGRAAIAAENVALRHQLGVLRRSVKRPRIRAGDRLLWTLFVRFWSGWRESLIIVKRGRWTTIDEIRSRS